MGRVVRNERIRKDGGRPFDPPSPPNPSPPPTESRSGAERRAAFPRCAAAAARVSPRRRLRTLTLREARYGSATQKKNRMLWKPTHENSGSGVPGRFCRHCGTGATRLPLPRERTSFKFLFFYLCFPTLVRPRSAKEL